MRIALVDPSRTTRLIVSRLLEARGHEVVAFDDERMALSRIEFDLGIEALITSAELTHMTGLELCWQVRLLASHARPIYILMMSSQHQQRTLAEALDAGADDFIGKPPFAEELYARLRAAERMAAMQQELVRLATIDPLTGLCNRRGFFEQATQVYARTFPGGDISAVLLDIDNFKQINDSYGHETGDEAIRVCARAAQLEGSVAGRLGGDEFALLLERRPLCEAVKIAEDLRRRLAARPFDTGKGKVTLTWSIGVGEARPGDSVDQLLARADAALYSAKASGRNQVAGAPPGLSAVKSVAQHGIARASAN